MDDSKRRFAINERGGDLLPDPKKEQMRAQIKDAMERYTGKITKLTAKCDPEKLSQGWNNPLKE